MSTPPHSAPDPMKILIFRYGQLGDTLVALPALWALRERFPGARLTLLSEKQEPWHISPQEVLPKSGLVDEYWQFETRKSGRTPLDIARLALRIRRERFDRLAYLAPSLREKSLRPLRDRLFFEVLAGLRGGAGYRETEHIAPKRPGTPLPQIKSEAECLLGRLARDGIAPPGGKPPRCDLALDEDERRRALDWWQRHAPGLDKRRCVAIGIGGKWPSKLWPASHYTELGRRLIDALGLFPVVFGGPAEAEQARALCAAWGAGLAVAGELGVRDTAGVMEGMAFFVGNDTGALHLAAAAGLRCVGLYAAQDWPGRWPPMGEGHRVLRMRIDCEGCRLPLCPRDNECLRRITPEEAFLACQSAAPPGGAEGAPG